MPSLTEIYSSLIENPDIQPPEGGDREAYVVDLAKQRLRQYKNNEKALSLGMEKSAIQNFADFVLEKSEKTRQMYATFMDDKKLTPERIESSLKTFERKNPAMGKVKPEDLEQLVEDDDNEKSAYVALKRLKHMLDNEYIEHNEKTGGFRTNPNKVTQVQGGEAFGGILAPGHPAARQKQNTKAKDRLKAGRDFEKVKRAYVTQEEGSRDLTREEQRLLDKYADDIEAGYFDDILDDEEREQEIKNAEKGATGTISTERSEDEKPDDLDKNIKENYSKVEAFQRKLAEDQREAADKQAKSEDAEKQWDTFETKIKSTLKKHFGKRAEFKNTDWKSIELNDPKISGMIDYLGAEAKEGTKSQKATVLGIHDAIRKLPNLSESFQDEEKAAAYDNFFSDEEEDSPSNKFYRNNSNLTLRSDMSDGIRRATIKHFGGDVNNITKEAIADLADEDLNKIWEDSHNYVTESTKKDLNPEDIKEKKLSLLERTFPTQIPLGTFKDAYDEYQAEQQKQSLAKVDEGGDAAEAELQSWYKDESLQHLRDTYGFDDNQIMELAHKEFERTKGKKGPDGSNKPADKQIKLSELDTKTFREYHKNFLSGKEEMTVDNMAGAMREGKSIHVKTGQRTKLNFNNNTNQGATQFNTWRNNAFEQFIKDAKIAPLASDNRKDIEESFWEQVAEKTGLPLSLVRTGSNEDHTEKMKLPKKDSDGKIMLDKKGEQIEGKLESDEEYVASGGTLGLKPILDSNMKQAIHGAMRSIYLKEMTDRKLPFIDDLIPENALPITEYDDLEKVDTADPNINKRLQDHFNRQMALASKVDDGNIKKLIERNKQYRGQGIDPTHSAQGFLNRIQNNQAGIDSKELRDEVRKEADQHTIFLPPEDGLDWNSDDALNQFMTAAGITDDTDAEEQDVSESSTSEESSASTGDPNEIKDITPADSTVESQEQDTTEVEVDSEDEAKSAVDKLAQETAKRNIAQSKKTDLDRKTKQVFDRTTSDEDRLKILDDIIEEHGQDAVDSMLTNLAQIDLDAAKNNESQNPAGLNNQRQNIQDALKEKASEGVDNVINQHSDIEGAKEEPSSEASDIDKIKDLINTGNFSDAAQKKIDAATNLNELETAVGRTQTPITINSVPLRGATLFEMMRSGLFAMDGSPTNRGDKFLDLMGERFESVTDMFTDDMQKAYTEKYGTAFKFDKDKYSLSKAALSHMVAKWNSLQDEDNQIPWEDNVLNEDGTEITKINGDPIEEGFFEKDFTYGDDAPHFKESIWGEDGEVAGHDVFSRMLLAGIISSRLNGAGEQGTQAAFKEIFDTGGIARPSDEIINNQDEIPKKNDEIISPQELKDSNTKIKPPKGNSVDAVGSENQQGQPIELNVDKETGEIKEEPVDPKDATNVDFSVGTQANMFGDQDLSGDTETETDTDTAGVDDVGSDIGGDDGDNGDDVDEEVADEDDDEDETPSGTYSEPRTPSSKGTPPTETTSKKENQINRMMKEQFGDDWKERQADDDAIDAYHEHLSDMDDKKFGVAYDKYHDREMNRRSQGEAAEEKDRAAAEKTQADEEAKAQAEENRLQEEATRKEQRVKMVQELKDAKNSDGSSVLPESAHQYLDSETDLSHDEIVALHRENVRDKAFTHDDPPPESEEPMDREQYFQELADYDGIDLEEAEKRYGEDGTFSEDEFKKKIHNMFNKPKVIPEDLDRDGMLDKLAELRDMSREDIDTEYEHHDDKEIRQVLHGQINQKASREVADKKTEQARVGKQNARDANASLKHQFKTPMEVKDEFDPKRERAGKDGEMSTSEAADMFRSLLQHASQNHHHYDEDGIERLNELNHNLVRHLEKNPEGMEELDKIHSEVQMATDLDIEYGSDKWYEHLDKTAADRAEKETREREDAEAEEAEANKKFDDREIAVDRAFAHPHHKDHSNRLHSFDLEIEIGEDGKPTVTSADHKGGIHHFEHSDGIVRENSHDSASHRGSGRSEHAPYDPDHTPEQNELYQKIHAHRQRMDDLESPIRETERKHSKEKADQQSKFDAESKKRSKLHGRRRTGIQEKMSKQHSELTEAYDKDMESLSADLDDVTGSNQDQMDALREEKKAEHRELRRRHDRNAATSKERMDASGAAMSDQHETHAKALEDLDAEHEQDRADFDAGTGKWGEELQRTNPEVAARYADPDQREAVKEEMYNTHSRLRAELENAHADRIESMEAFHAENTTSHDDTTTQHANEQEEFERTSKDDVQKLQGEIVRATKEIRDKINKRTDAYKESSDKISAEANDGYDKIDKYVEATEAEYLAEHDANKESLSSKHQGELEEVVGASGSDMLDASKIDGMLKDEYLNSAGDDEVVRERLNRNLDSSDLGATENSHTRHAAEESTRIQGEAQEAAQSMMDDDTPPPGSPSPSNPNLVYKPGPGKNWVTRDSYNAAVAKGLLARNNNSISFSNQGGNIIAHHGTNSWEVSEGVEGKGARTSQEAIGNTIHHGASQWSDEDGTSFADKAATLKEGESFEISNDHFNQHSPALVRGLKGEKADGTTPSTDDTPTETGETPEEPKQGASAKFLGRMGTNVFSPAAQAMKQSTNKAKQNFANDLRSGRWAKTNMTASGEGTDKRYQDGYTWYGKPKNIDPDKDHVGQASLSRELNRFNPFKGQKAKAEISTENQIENRSRAVQALQTHVQGQNSTLRQMGAASSPTIKPTVGASTQTLQDHVQNKQGTGTTPPTPPAAT